jgi:hypothetical protein
VQNSIHIKSGVVIYCCFPILYILTILNLVGKKPTDTVTSIRHQRISHSLSDGKYTVHPANRSYNSLQDLIAEETSELQLLHPYPGSKYLSLFVEQDVSGYKEEPSQQPGDKNDKGI